MLFKGDFDMIVTFCGHSNFRKSFNYEEKMIAIFEKEIADKSAEFYLGGYGNFDNFAYACCKKYKKTHPNVSLIFVTPYIREEYQKAHLGFHNERYDGMVYPPIENIPLKFAILYRNKYMVEESDFVIAYITHNYGGAYKMYSYAKSKGKNVINIADN